MAKGPTPLDPVIVYNAIVRLGGARLGQIKIELEVGRTTVATAISKLASKGIIHRRGYAWFPEVTGVPGAPKVTGVEASKVTGVTGVTGVDRGYSPQVTGVTGNHVDLHGSKNTATGTPATDGEPDASFAGMKDEPLTEASRPDGGSVQQKDPDETVALAAFRAASATASVNGEPSHVEVMKFILTYVANVKSRHNQVEGLKKSRDKEYQIKGYTQKEKIDAMRDLAIHLVGAVAQETLVRDLGWISDSMDLLVDNWRSTASMAWARHKMRVAREANMVSAVAPAAAIGAPVADEEDEMAPGQDAVHSNMPSDNELTPFSGGPAPEAMPYQQTPREAHQAELDAAHEALAAEADAHAQKALEAVAAPEADDDDEDEDEDEPAELVLPSMPIDIYTIDDKVYWCVSHGHDRPAAIAEAIQEHQGAVTSSLRSQTSRGRFEEYTERYVTRWRLAA